MVPTDESPDEGQIAVQVAPGVCQHDLAPVAARCGACEPPANHPCRSAPLRSPHRWRWRPSAHTRRGQAGPLTRRRCGCGRVSTGCRSPRPAPCTRSVAQLTGPIAHPRRTPRPPPQVLSEHLASLLSSCGLVDLKQLCIDPGKVAWMAYVDIYVLDAGAHARQWQPAAACRHSLEQSRGGGRLVLPMATSAPAWSGHWRSCVPSRMPARRWLRL
jgi:hypothetical protein